MGGDESLLDTSPSFAGLMVKRASEQKRWKCRSGRKEEERRGRESCEVVDADGVEGWMSGRRFVAAAVAPSPASIRDVGPAMGRAWRGLPDLRLHLSSLHQGDAPLPQEAEGAAEAAVIRAVEGEEEEEKERGENGEGGGRSGKGRGGRGRRTGETDLPGWQRSRALGPVWLRRLLTAEVEVRCGSGESDPSLLRAVVVEHPPLPISSSSSWSWKESRIAPLTALDLRPLLRRLNQHREEL